MGWVLVLSALFGCRDFGGPRSLAGVSVEGPTESKVDTGDCSFWDAGDCVERCDDMCADFCGDLCTDEADCEGWCEDGCFDHCEEKCQEVDD